MNIKVQTCGLIVVALLYLFIRVQKSLQLHRQQLFLWVLAVTAISLSLDIASVVAITQQPALEPVVVKEICRAYLASLVWAGWIAYSYIMNDVVGRKTYRIIMWGTVLMNLAFSALAFILPMEIYSDGSGSVYTFGRANEAVYACAGLYILLILAACVIWRKVLNNRKNFGMLLWIFLLLTAAVIQFFIKEQLLIGFALSIGDLVLFVLIENPEAAQDRSLGCFNSYSLNEFVTHMLEEKRVFGIFRLEMDAAAVLEQTKEDVNIYLRNICKRLGRHHKGWVFKDNDMSLMILDDSMGSLKSTARQILTQISANTAILNSSRFMLLTNPEQLGSMSEIRHFFAFVKNSDLAPLGELTPLGESMLRKYRMKSLMEQEIRDALAEDRVEVFYQPIYCLREERIRSAEALVRLRGRDGSMISPGAFIPVAEESGLIRELGEVVIEKTCRLLKESDLVANGLKYIEVNLSVVQCESGDLAERITGIADKFEVDHSLINLEITETASISSKRILLENMQALLDSGFSFSLDDFGQGQSNLMYVVDMPVSIIKLDMELTKAFFRSYKAKQAVRAIVDMAHRMKLKVVCEGVETAEEEQILRGENVDFIQGFFHYRPLPVSEFLQVMRNSR